MFVLNVGLINNYLMEPVYAKTVILNKTINVIHAIHLKGNIYYNAIISIVRIKSGLHLNSVMMVMT